MKRLLVATGNPGKLGEIAVALEGVGVVVVGLDTLPEAAEVAETGATFEDNARIKAAAYSCLTPMPVVADDSGLEVDALDGAPGVHSARYGGPGLNDAARTRKLVEALRAVPDPDRTVRFRCVLAVASEGRVLATFEGAVEGRITREPRGSGGFGYDPVFFHPPSGCTFAELTRTEKQAVSHRGAAVEALVRAIRDRDPRLRSIG